MWFTCRQIHRGKPLLLKPLRNWSILKTTEIGISNNFHIIKIMMPKSGCSLPIVCPIERKCRQSNDNKLYIAFNQKHDIFESVFSPVLIKLDLTKTQSNQTISTVVGHCIKLIYVYTYICRNCLIYNNQCLTIFILWCGRASVLGASSPTSI